MQILRKRFKGGKSMKKILIIIFFGLLSFSAFAAGVFEKGSGEYKTFQYNDGNRYKEVKAEYVGLFLKSFEFEGSGAHKTLVGYGCIRPWNSTEWTDWEEISREKASYMTNSELEDTIAYIDSVIFTEFEGQKIILEMIPNKDGKYWWWTKHGDIRFFQKMYFVKGF